MKIYLIFEEHERDSIIRESTVSSLLKLGYAVAVEGHHDLVIVDGRYGLEDILYQIYTEVAASYLSVCVGDIEGTNNALEEIKKIYDIRNINNALNFKIEAYDDHGMTADVKEEVMKILYGLILWKGKITQNKLKVFQGIVYKQLISIRRIVVAYKRNAEYLSMDWKEASMYLSTRLVSMNIKSFDEFPLLGGLQRQDFSDIVLKELRDVAINSSIHTLATILPSEGKDNLAVILGASHAKDNALVQSMINLCLYADHTLHIYHKYDGLREELGIIEKIEKKLGLFDNYDDDYENPPADTLDELLRGTSLS